VEAAMTGWRWGLLNHPVNLLHRATNERLRNDIRNNDVAALCKRAQLIVREVHDNSS
jgi:hypothetical protein